MLSGVDWRELSCQLGESQAMGLPKYCGYEGQCRTSIALSMRKETIWRQRYKPQMEIENIKSRKMAGEVQVDKKGDHHER